MNAVGESVKRKDGNGKANGTARYADDLAFPGMLHGRTIRSTVAKGRLNGWKLETGRRGLTIVDHRDIPGRNIVALIVDDQPCLVEREIRHAAEPVLLLAHENREALLGARVVLDELAEEPLYDPLVSAVAFKEILIEKGKLDRGFAQADLVVEGEYRTGHQEHVYIETNAVIAVPEDGGITV
ncbi:MAG TPA: molybdopterin cofactor-binding domain-containing protein, partial [Gemmatimonadales bacterium]|nr:molybdopterin cofactor-binding domain-containing protein [Gemmatimonadales bacterium]